jgi:hypothetical protein
MVRATLMVKGRLGYGYRVVSVGMASALLACAASWNGQVYHGDTMNFRTGAIPPGWRKVDDQDTLLAFRDAGRDLVISVNGRCGKDGDDVPLRALTEHLFLYFTERQIEDQRRLELDGREALRTELSAKLDGVARRFVVYVLKKNGCVYDFILIAPPTLDPAAKGEFDRFVSGFATSPSRPPDPGKVQVLP